MCGIEVEHDGENIIAIRGDKNVVLSTADISLASRNPRSLQRETDLW